MGVLVKEMLRRICVEFGWNYVVFWKGVRCGNQMKIVWEDGHCERTSTAPAASGFEAMDLLIKESGVLRSSQNGCFSQLGCQAEDRVRTLVFKLMATQVHVLGDGVVGKAALTGKHEWLLGEVRTDNGSTSKGLAEINNQLLAGIKTIAIIPVLSYGVVQLGSTQMVLENFGFINHVRDLFEQQHFAPGVLLSDNNQKTLCQKIKLHESVGTQMSIKQFGEVCTSINSLPPFNDNNSNCQHFKHQDSRVVTEPCASSTPLYNQMQANVPKVVLAKDDVPSIVMPLSIGCQEANWIISNPNVSLVKNELPCESNSQRRHQPLTCLQSSQLTFLDEELLYMSGIKPIEFANNCKLILDNTNLHQLQSYGCNSLNLLQGCESISSSARSQVQNNSNAGADSIRSQCASSSDRSLLNLILAGNLEPSHLNSIEKMAQAGSSAEMMKNNSSPFQAFSRQSTQVDMHGNSPYSSLHGNPPDGHVQGSRINHDSAFVENARGTEPLKNGTKKPGFQLSSDEKISLSTLQSSSGVDLFDALHLDQYKSTCSHGHLDDVEMRSIDANAHELSTVFSTCTTGLEAGPVYNASDDQIFCNGIFSEVGSDQLLDAVVSQFNPAVKYEMEDNELCKTSITKISGSSLHTTSPIKGWVASPEKMDAETFGIPPALIKSEPANSGSAKSSCSMERGEGCFSQRNGGYKSQLNLWIEGQKMNSVNHSVVPGKRVDEVGKLTNKRARPGENTRPRPKDRQMIQDRVKELREIIPNGAKCSIDALLEKTIKHMLFLQSVTKNVDKLKDTGEPKMLGIVPQVIVVNISDTHNFFLNHYFRHKFLIINKDGGVLLKDNFEGGVTWAFEVGSQSMICPIIVEDLHPPRQMLVEMLCEERGHFLEIADLVRGLGLTILKGVMEARNDKIWARFAVEANRDVTRMEIFLSLVRLLEPSMLINKTLEGVDNLNKPNMFHSASSIPDTGLSDRLW